LTGSAPRSWNISTMRWQWRHIVGWLWIRSGFTALTSVSATFAASFSLTAGLTTDFVSGLTTATLTEALVGDFSASFGGASFAVANFGPVRASFAPLLEARTTLPALTLPLAGAAVLDFRDSLPFVLFKDITPSDSEVLFLSPLGNRINLVNVQTLIMCKRRAGNGGVLLPWAAGIIAETI
jgi:hypothetical protein